MCCISVIMQSAQMSLSGKLMSARLDSFQLTFYTGLHPLNPANLTTPTPPTPPLRLKHASPHHASPHLAKPARLRCPNTLSSSSMPGPVAFITLMLMEGFLQCAPPLPHASAVQLFVSDSFCQSRSA